MEDFYKFHRISKKYCNIFWKTLTLNKYCDGIDDNIFNFILQCVCNLKSLNLTCCDKITNDGLVHLPRTLQTLDLSCCNQITDYGLKFILPTVEIIRQPYEFA